MPPDTQPPSSTEDARRPAIADYDLLRVIGQGSYGDVWLARGVTGAFRAVKVVWRNRFNDPHPFDREFKGLREFTAISLVEAHQLALLHAGRNDEEGFFYYVMELADDAVSGRDIDPSNYLPLTLREMRSRRGRLPTAECIALSVEVARALAGLHARKLVHRDIKPSNVIIVGGVAKLADIGLVASASDARTFVGTEGFVPPEGPGEPTADVFSLGKLVYELSTGRDRTDYPRLPEDFGEIENRKLFLELNEIVLRACDASPQKRYPDAGALLEDLLLLQAGRSVRRLRFVERQLRDAVRLVVVLAAVAGVAAGGAFVERRRLASETERRQRAESALEDLARKAFYAATLSRAERALESGNYGVARSILNEVAAPAGQPDMRDFEWRALWREAQGDPAHVLASAGPALTRVRYSPGGKTLATQDSGNGVALWNVADGRRILRLSMASPPLFAGFSADGRWLIGADGRQRLQRWSARDGSASTTSMKSACRPLAPLGNDRALYYSYEDKSAPARLCVWDFARDAEVSSFAVPHTGAEGGSYFASAVSADGRTCAMALIFGRAQFATWRLVVIDCATGEAAWDEAIPHRLPAMAFGADSRYLACGFTDTSEVGLLDLSERKWTWRTPVLGAPNVIAYRQPGLFCIGGRGRRLEVVNASSGALVGELKGQAGEITDLSVNHETSEIASASDAGDLRVWPASLSSAITAFAGFRVDRGIGRNVCLSRDGSRMAATFEGRQVRIVPTDGVGPPVDLPEALSPVLFTADASRIWVVGLDGRLVRWTLSAKPARDASIVVAKEGASLIDARAARDGRRLIAFDSHGRVSLVDAEERTIKGDAEGDPSGLFWAAISGEGHFVAASGIQQNVRIWSLPSLRLVSQWRSEERVTNGCFSPDERTLALTLKSGTLELHPLGDPLHAMVRHTTSGTAYGLSFHPTEPRLFVGGQDGIVHVFNTADWTEMTQLAAAYSGTEPGMIYSEAASADGSALAAYTESGLIRLWRR